MEISLRDKQCIVENESDKSRKSKEAKLQSKSVFDGLMKNIEKEQRERQIRMETLQKSIKNKEESMQRKLERNRRQ